MRVCCTCDAKANASSEKQQCLHCNMRSDAHPTTIRPMTALRIDCGYMETAMWKGITP